MESPCAIRGALSRSRRRSSSCGVRHGTRVADVDRVGAHDKAFRKLMKEKGVADALLRERLPRALVRRFAGPPQLLSESFVDDRLKGAFADVVIRVPLRGGDDAYVYCLVEHKRTSEARVRKRRSSSAREGGKMKILMLPASFSRTWRAPCQSISSSTSRPCANARSTGTRPGPLKSP